MSASKYTEEELAEKLSSECEIHPSKDVNYGEKYEITVDCNKIIKEKLAEQKKEIKEKIEQRFYGANDVKVKDIIEFINSLE